MDCCWVYAWRTARETCLAPSLCSYHPVTLSAQRTKQNVPSAAGLGDEGVYDRCGVCGTNVSRLQYSRSLLFPASRFDPRSFDRPQPLLLPVPFAWVQENRCCVCEAHFTKTRRRHHCRHCGGLCCQACSPDKVIMPYLVSYRRYRKEGT